MGSCACDSGSDADDEFEASHREDLEYLYGSVRSLAIVKTPIIGSDSDYSETESTEFECSTSEPVATRRVSIYQNFERNEETPVESIRDASIVFDSKKRKTSKLNSYTTSTNTTTSIDTVINATVLKATENENEASISSGELLLDRSPPLTSTRRSSLNSCYSESSVLSINIDEDDPSYRSLLQTPHRRSWLNSSDSGISDQPDDNIIVPQLPSNITTDNIIGPEINRMVKRVTILDPVPDDEPDEIVSNANEAQDKISGPSEIRTNNLQRKTITESNEPVDVSRFTIFNEQEKLGNDERDPRGLITKLMPHQKEGLTWAKWRESQEPRGGILADEKGSGRTLIIISLILSDPNDDVDSSSSDDSFENEHHRAGTLVICPVSSLNHWSSEIENHCRPGVIDMFTFYGKKKHSHARSLSRYTIVLTTFQTVVYNFEKLQEITWTRLVLDDSNFIKNRNSRCYISISELIAERKWVLTGTQVENKDLLAYLGICHCNPFGRTSRLSVQNKEVKQTFSKIMESVMLRRTKYSIKMKELSDSQIILPKKTVELIVIDLDKDERSEYNRLLIEGKKLVQDLHTERENQKILKELYHVSGIAESMDKNKEKSLQKKIQTNLLRLCQVCSHPALAQSANLDGTENPICHDDDITEEIVASTMLRFSTANVIHSVENTRKTTRVTLNVADPEITDKILPQTLKSSKIRAIMRVAKKIIKKNEKMVVVSQWGDFLHMIMKIIQNLDGTNPVIFTDDISEGMRKSTIDEINNRDSNMNVLLLTAYNTFGLNIIWANHILITDMCWDPQLEIQAVDSIYRLGQKKDVFVYKFVCKNTIEERILGVQEKKLKTINAAVDTIKSISSKLTMEDLDLMFD